MVGGHPVGPSAEGCPAGRRCLPPNGYRVPEATTGALAVDAASRLYFTWADFRNGGGTCTGPASTATPPCNNDVFYAVSTDGGAMWSAARNVTPGAMFGQTAQWQPWSAVVANGGTLWVAFYDRHYGACETTGCNDITLARIRHPASGAPVMTYKRLTTASMPNLTTANNPIQAGFLGDYLVGGRGERGAGPRGLGRHARAQRHGRGGRLPRDRPAALTEESASARTPAALRSAPGERPVGAGAGAVERRGRSVCRPGCRDRRAPRRRRAAGAGRSACAADRARRGRPPVV
jgi:hypothetical protein